MVTVILPTLTIKRLDDRLKKSPPTFKFSREMFICYLYLIYRRGTSQKFKQEADYHDSKSYTKLCDEILVKLGGAKRKQYLDYLYDNNSNNRLINRKEHSTGGGKWSKTCRRYKLNLTKEEILRMDISEEVLSSYDTRKFQHYFKGEDRPQAIRALKHLTKWFDEGLEFDANYAYELVRKHLQKKEKNPVYYLHNIHRLQTKNYWITRNKTSDGRLHTNLTNLPKFLKPSLKYKGEELYTIDIKNSQPYFFVSILNNIIYKQGKENERPLLWFMEHEKAKVSYKDYVQRTWNLVFRRKFDDVSLSKSIGFMPYLNKINLNILSLAEFDQFKRLALSGDLYEYYASHLDIKEDGNGNIIKRKFKYNKEKRKWEFDGFKQYDDERDYGKAMLFFVFFCDHRQKNGKLITDPDYRVFKRLFPTITELIQNIKEYPHRGLKKAYRHTIFSGTLQRTESTCILDNVTKQIAEEYPDMPLFTVHDSITTTKSNFDILEQKVLELIYDYTGLEPTLHREYWVEGKKGEPSESKIAKNPI